MEHPFYANIIPSSKLSVAATDKDDENENNITIIVIVMKEWISYCIVFLLVIISFDVKHL